MQRVYVTIALFPLLALFVMGCGSVASKLAEPEWGENFALKGQSDVPNLTDGSMYTTGQTLQPEYVKGEKTEETRFTEVNITFKEPKDIKRIVVRRRTEDNVPVDLDIDAMVDGKWTTIKELRSADKDDIDVKVTVVTDKLKVKAQRATRTADGKSALAKTAKSTGNIRGRRGAEVDRVLYQPIKFAEIELYGYKEKTESQVPAQAPSK